MRVLRKKVVALISLFILFISLMPMATFALDNNASEIIVSNTDETCTVKTTITSIKPTNSDPGRIIIKAELLKTNDNMNRIFVRVENKLYDSDPTFRFSSTSKKTGLFASNTWTDDEKLAMLESGLITISGPSFLTLGATSISFAQDEGLDVGKTGTLFTATLPVNSNYSVDWQKGFENALSVECDTYLNGTFSSTIKSDAFNFPSAGNGSVSTVYSVITTLGNNMTVNGGDLSQTELSGAMTNVVVSPDNGYTLAAPTIVGSGVTAVANADGTYTISGTPTSDVTVTFADAVANVVLPTYTAYLQKNPSVEDIAAGGTFTTDVYMAASDGMLAGGQLELDCVGGTITNIALTEGLTNGEKSSDLSKISFYGYNGDATNGIKVATVTVSTAETATEPVVLSIKDGGKAAVSGSYYDKDVTLEDATKSVTVNITEKDLFSCSTYADASGKYLVQYTGAVEDGKVVQYTSGSTVTDLYYSEKYSAWVFLADSDLSSTLSNADFSLVTGDKTSVTIQYDGDVNKNGTINIVDAQIAYDLTNNVYKTFEALPMNMWLSADVNTEFGVAAGDARAIQCIIHGITE